MYAGGRNGVRRIKWFVRIWRHGRRANKCTGNRTRALTTGGGECTAADSLISSRGNPKLEFDQTANLEAEAREYQWTSPVGADAEPVPEQSLIRLWVGNPALQ